MSVADLIAKMGLDILIEGEPLGEGREHQIWHGAYGAFALFRAQIAACLDVPSYHRVLELGYPADTDPIYKAVEREVQTATTPGLWELLIHSDTTGIWTPAECRLVVQALEKARDRLPWNDNGGHVGNWRATTDKFIRGLRVCIDQNRNAIFC